MALPVELVALVNRKLEADVTLISTNDVGKSINRIQAIHTLPYKVSPPIPRIVTIYSIVLVKFNREKRKIDEILTLKKQVGLTISWEKDNQWTAVSINLLKSRATESETPIPDVNTLNACASIKDMVHLIQVARPDLILLKTYTEEHIDHLLNTLHPMHMEDVAKHRKTSLLKSVRGISTFICLFKNLVIDVV
uniref:Uncharacterized protein n=1 Tax=Clandestinovirus TaxID=2831644 RepID=A0A8F8PN28_9VIRU|nr:hypothetical protein KOM_12_142 [Clandestinovirus]